ncbi:MAG: DUF1858 domain-containing protein [Anaerolineae bacterium]|nr:DUF1858 domain-containing protein [Anaerolineae bacterium]
MGSKSKSERAEYETALRADLSVDTVMQRWPETVSVFQAFRTACVGCLMAPFDTIEDVARNYRLDLDELMHALRQRIDAARRGGGPGP